MSETATPTAVKHAPGTFCWWELATTDLERSKAFYGALFGWTHNEMPVDETQVYVMFQSDGKDVAAAYRLTPEMQAKGVPRHWGVYLATDDADAAAERARSLGGTVVVEPCDVFDAGRLAVLQDPTGGAFSVWQPKAHPGAAKVNEHNAVCWNELATDDPVAAASFYAGLFGYETETHDMGHGPYTVLMREGALKGGLFRKDASMGEIPTHWMTYFSVADCDAGAERAKALGAEVVVPPTDLPTVGRFSVLRDPAGAVFSIITLTAQG